MVDSVDDWYGDVWILMDNVLVIDSIVWIVVVDL